MKVYRKVEIDDRHVGVYDVYFTSSGVKVFGVVWLEQSTCLWKCTKQDGDEHYVTHCIEEIELPSEEEIEQESIAPFKNWGELQEEYDVFIKEDSKIFQKGANFILNKLKGE